MGILEDALNVISGPRPGAYGPPHLNHDCTARLWSAWLYRRFQVALPLSPRDVCWLNILQKASRDAHSPTRDNLVDVAGYAANAQQCEDHECQTPHSSVLPAGISSGTSAGISPARTADESSKAAARAPQAPCPQCGTPDHARHRCEGMEGL